MVAESGFCRELTECNACTACAVICKSSTLYNACVDPTASTCWGKQTVLCHATPSLLTFALVWHWVSACIWHEAPLIVAPDRHAMHASKHLRSRWPKYKRSTTATLRNEMLALWHPEQQPTYRPHVKLFQILVWFFQKDLYHCPFAVQSSQRNSYIVLYELQNSQRSSYIALYHWNPGIGNSKTVWWRLSRDLPHLLHIPTPKSFQWPPWPSSPLEQSSYQVEILVYHHHTYV